MLLVMYRIFLGICFFQLFCVQAFSQSKQSFSRITLKHREHKGVGYNEGYSTLGCFFSPKVSSYATSFFDARLHVFNDAYLASNLGAGARFSSRDQKYTVGLNAYYDYRNYQSLSSHQLASGLEILSRYIDFRLNGYYPFSGLYQDSPFLFGGFEKHSMLIAQKVLYALPCADAELGFTLPDPFDQIGLYIGIGSYYLFKQQGFNKSVGNTPGGKVRLTAAPMKYLSFGVDYSYDSLFKGRANGFIALNIPIGLSQLRKSHKQNHSGKTVLDLQTQDVVRNEIIPVVKKQHYFPHRNQLGNPLNFVFVNHKKFDTLGPNGGDGTFETPYTTLAAAQESSLPGDYIYVFFGDGSDRGYDSGFEFKQDQTLVSSAARVLIGHVDLPALTPGHYPLITKSQGAVVEAVSASNVAMHGFR
ncbi:MAG: inverse autotransporter beta domain-containing protein, partial [Chlamydiota bacterium]